MTTHTDQEYEAELVALRTKFLGMAQEVETMIQASVSAFVENDSAVALVIAGADDRIDALEIEADALCLRLFALRQPVASDLRQIAATFKSITVLERVGDIAVAISERVRELKKLNQAGTPPGKFIELAHAAQAMFSDVMGAFAERDALTARAIIGRYDATRALHGDVMEVLLHTLAEKSEAGERALKLETIARLLKRLGGHAVNLAEMIVFMVEGKDIRHTKH